VPQFEFVVCQKDRNFHFILKSPAGMPAIPAEGIFRRAAVKTRK
jgi:hypothetical protein